MRIRDLGISVSTVILTTGLLFGGAAVAQTSSAQSGSQPAAQADSSAASTSTSSPMTLVDAGKIYNDPNPTSWVGKSVTLKNVIVQDTNDTGNFWVGSDGDHRLLIVKASDDPTLAAMRFHKGDIVTVSGVIHPASDYMAQQTTASKGSMSDAKESSGVFLLANNIAVTSSTQH